MRVSNGKFSIFQLNLWAHVHVIVYVMNGATVVYIDLLQVARG